MENHIEQLVETCNQAMSNDRSYHEKMKLAFDKKKVGKRLVTNFILGDHVCMDGYLTVRQDQGQGWG